MSVLYRFFIVVFLLLSPAAVNAMVDIAVVDKLRGEAVAVTLAGASRALGVGDKILLGETIKTGERSQIVLKFNDQSVFELGPKAEMNVSKFSRGSAQEKDGFVSTISVGIFRFVSGLIARDDPNSMLVNGPVASIGIRGTHVLGEFRGDTATVILLKPEEARPTAINVSNSFGAVTIDEPGYGTDVPDANSAPTPPRKMRVRTINNMMNTIRSIHRVNPSNIPRPRPRR